MTTMSFRKSTEWTSGLRSYFEYRDLGMVEATEGRVLANVIRAVGPCSGPSGYHTHDVEFQLNYVLRGWIRVELEDVGEVRFEAGDSWNQEPNIKHEVLEFSDDFEVLEICMPAEFQTRDAER
ncbi:MAG: cupin domain-containing protein [Fuerstiella sp.]|nr:cupin domain-containing protein [Fuerstiella sp.]